jgi:hypothetical protein
MTSFATAAMHPDSWLGLLGVVQVVAELLNFELIPGTVTVGSVGVFVFADFEGPESADS